MRVLVTRPLQDATSWVHELKQAGLDALALPLIAVRAASDQAPVRAAWARIDEYDAVMFVSGNAVQHFFASKSTLAPVFTAQAAIKTRAYVPGPGSFKALMAWGALPQYVDAPAMDAGQFDSEALWAVVQTQVHAGFRLLIVRGSGAQGAVSGDGVGRDWFADQARTSGATVDFVVAYQRMAPVLQEEERNLVAKASHDGSVWLLSSSEALGNLKQACPDLDWSRGRAVATHHRIAQAAKVLGFAVVCESRPTLPDIVASIESLR